MSIRVTLSANAGAAIELGGVRIWVDALHDTQVPGFSTLRRQQLQQLWTAEPFQAPDAIVYTTGCSSPTARRQSCCRGTVPWGRRRCCR